LKEVDSVRKSFEEYQQIWGDSTRLFHEPPIFDSDVAFTKLHQKINLLSPSSSKYKKNVNLIKLNVWRVAASFIMLLSVLLLAHQFLQTQPVTYAIYSGDCQYDHILPDGSKVTMKKGSSLSYSFFDKNKKRQISFSGVGFFDVVRDTTRNFEVVTGNFVTRVLGTSFLIEATEYAKVARVTVVTGRVEVSTSKSSDRKVLVPGQRATISKGIEKFSVDSALVEEGHPWLRTTLTFDNTPLSQILSDLMLYFDTTIQLQNPQLSTCTFTGTFDHPELSEILKVICTSLDLKWKSNDRGQILLYGAGCLPVTTDSR
jgi:ferric-dicitrate binding protein FerR (iron transport regulator)